MAEGIRRAKEKLAAIENENENTLSFENTFQAFENATEQLELGWTRVEHLDAVCNNEKLRSAYNKALPMVTQFFTEIFLNENLWKILSRFAQEKENHHLSEEQNRFIEETCAAFKRHGANLPKKDKEKLRTLEKALAQKTQKYSENVLDSTNEWLKVIEDEKLLDGLPESSKAAAKQKSQEKGISKGENTWAFTLHAPSMMPVMQYAKNDSLRKEFWEAANTIGKKAPHENTRLVCEILKLRDQKAKLLGFKDFGDFALERRMAKTGSKALGFIETLHTHALPALERDIQTLEDFKAKERNSTKERLQPWEVAYWAETLRLAAYDFNDESLRPYFPINQVIDGLFEITQQLFGFQIEERSCVYIDPETQKKTFIGAEESNAVEVWHPDVRYYELKDTNGNLLGGFYTDWHPRDSKRSGAWMNHLSTGSLSFDEKHEPHFGLICGNLTPPIGNKPALLTHEEVQTVFHEFGHLLHHLLGEVKMKSLNGTRVAWDFVELPSQILENWCWEKESLDLFAKHYETGELIPDWLFEKMTQARTYLEGLSTMRQLCFAKMDLELHMHWPNISPEELEEKIQEICKDYQPRYKTQPPSIICKFGHLFSDPMGYATGYYSYKWAEVLDADAFSRFKEEGILNSETGKAFRKTILSKGNSKDPDQLFRDFMSRDPDLNALLLRSGLIENPQLAHP